MTAARCRLVLAGAGHTHVEILRRLAEEAPESLRRRLAVTVVSTPERHLYSGMVPGYLHGAYTAEEISIDVAAITALAGGSFVDGRITAIDPAARRLSTEAGEAVAYDLLSVAVGSRAAGSERPEVAGNARLLKPLERVIGLRRRLLELAAAGGGPPAVVLVGGGAAGVELACAAAAVTRPAGGRVTLLEAGGEILAGYSRRFVRRAVRVLAGLGIRVVTGAQVEGVEEAAVRLAGGSRIAADEVVWATGAVGWPFLGRSGLAVDRRGFLVVDPGLRSVSDPRVFAAGDCATLADHPQTPKAGVYAVRHAPVLWQSLRAAVEGGERPTYRPQGSFLSILNTADGRALLRWKGVVSHSRWAWWLKDWIDRRFMNGYQRLTGRHG